MFKNYKLRSVSGGWLLISIILMTWLTITDHVHAAVAIVNSTRLNYNSLRVPSENALIETQAKSGTKRILMLRVEFVRDTLATTTGDGTFDYGSYDTLYFDPPPHDSLYFADNLEFLRFYWDKMSAGNIDIEYDIYPFGMQAAYQLPRQMWQYNYNNTTEQLDRGLAQLFYDAVRAADEDPMLTNWGDYDLVMIFHAGAGAEFDLGFTTTPHDLPSAWLVAEDLEIIDVFDGVPVDNNRYYIKGGLILPETETHEGVQISMAGVICSLFGHWLGLPALYDRDNGGVVVGKWSLMDRGFGNYFGAIPGQVDAWSRSYMGWIEPQIIQPSGLPEIYNIAALGFESEILTLVYKIPLGSQESFIISCRSRDPEQDSIAIAYDREGRKMVFKEDYSVDADPGFRVPVRIDNLDFDAPGSGILIWHVDESKTDLIGQGRFNSVDGQRGLDLEEADGAQDIGEDYPFLTPGYGTDYGVFFDAWYRDNNFHKEANEGRLVSFNDMSYPNARTNSGARSHVVLNDFSGRDTVMSFAHSHEWLLYSHSFTGNPYYGMAVGSFDADSTDQEIVIIGDSVTIIDGDGIILEIVDIPNEIMHSTSPVVIDYTGDGVDDIIWVGIKNITATIYGFTPMSGQPEPEIISSHEFLGGGIFSVIFSVSKYDEIGIDLIVAYTSESENSSTLVVKGLDHVHPGTLEFTHPVITSMHQFGGIHSRDFIIISDGNVDQLFQVSLFTYNEMNSSSELIPLGDLNELQFGFDPSIPPILADFDGSGLQDLFIINQRDGRNTTALIKDIAQDGLNNIEIFDNVVGEFSRAVPVDVDRDGRYEILGYRNNELIAYEYNGTIAAGYPIPIASPGASGSKTDFPLASLQVADLAGRDNWSFIFEECIENDSSNTKSSQVFGMDDRGRMLSGFPLNGVGEAVSVRLAQLDDDPDLEMVIATNGTIYAYDPGFTGELSDIWWGQPFRDNLHSNAVWEAAKPFEPSASAGLLIKNECYNWPNPAVGSTTIRYGLNFAAEVMVDIYDITGEKVITLRDTGMPGLPNEIIWDLQNIPRGGYIAMLKATGNGRSDRKKIKIAVLK